MARYLLDSNHASPLVTLHHPLRQKVLTAMQAGDIFSLCVPVLSETLFGISVLPRAVQNRAEWQKLRRNLFCYQLDEQDAEYAVDLQLSLRAKGRQLEMADALIAAIAIRYDLILLTQDGDFRPLTQLKRENWL
ncbi:MAG: PIN domain-containing protein [Acidobacteriota bacterium]